MADVMFATSEALMGLRVSWTSSKMRCFMVGGAGCFFWVALLALFSGAWSSAPVGAAATVANDFFWGEGGGASLSLVISAAGGGGEGVAGGVGVGAWGADGGVGAGGGLGTGGVGAGFLVVRSSGGGGRRWCDVRTHGPRGSARNGRGLGVEDRIGTGCRLRPEGDVLHGTDSI